ncbi:MAG: transglycosylase SLT domain-containing protein, partial [Proteobacteria bacterium]|nr:transglycosylase SLT domain-containing protein [Pseudomonadota bacterium]
MKKTSLPSKIAFLVFFLAVCHLTAGIGELRAAVEKFPAYPSIESNIAFWKDIYSKFDSSEGLIHDNLNLDIVYEVVSLEPRTKRGSRRRNKNRLKKIKNKYKYLLRKLAETQKPATKEEERVAALFGENRERGTLLTASQNIRFQRGQKDRFQKGLIRSRMHLAKIKSIFKDHGLSEDLAYLPHVESSFNYNAYSKYGAAGIWQFTYSTGKRFMTVNYTVDERWDPIRASYAAARLLKLNHQKLGDWALAITAYNHGATAMLRAQREKGSYERIVKEYNGRRFKFASRNFYSEFLAARDIAKRYEKEHAFPMIDPSIRTREVKLKGFVPVTRLTDYFKIDKASLRKLNLALREPVFRGQKYVPKGYRLRLPVRSGMDKLIAEMPSSMFESKQRRSRFYWVRKGDVAGAIARRHGITLEDLIRANNLNRRARIYAGQNLRIPSPEDAIALATRFEKRKGTRPQTTSSASAAKKLELATNN